MHTQGANIVPTDRNNDIQASKVLISWLKVLGYGLIILSILCNVIFYGSLSSGFFSALLYMCVGLFFDFLKITLIYVFVIFLSKENWHAMGICITAWVFLSLFSLLAGFGYMSVINQRAENQRLLASSIYQTRLNSLESATKNVESFSTFADTNIVSASQNKLKSLESEKMALLGASATNSINQRTGKSVESHVGDCTGTSFYHRKYCGAILSLDSQMAGPLKAIEGHQKYLSAVTFRNTAQKELSELDNSNAGTSVHPVFSNLSGLITVNPHLIKYVVLALLSIALEIFSSLVFYLRQILIIDTKAQNIPKHHINSTDYVQNADVYQQIMDDIQTKRLPNGSYRTLMNMYGLNQSQATSVRLRLVNDGKAKLNRRQEIDFV